jgi:hypothetical protein
MLGGEFGPLIGRLGSIVALLTTAGPVAAGVPVALAGVSVATGYWRDLEEQIKRVDEALKRFHSAEEKFAFAGQGEAKTIQAGLAAQSPYTRERFGEAYKYYADLLAQGVEKAKAAAAAPSGYLGNVPARDLAAILAGGGEPKTAEEARRMVEVARGQPAAFAELEVKAGAQKLTATGAQAVAESAFIQNQMGQLGSRFAEAVEGISRDVLLLQKGKELGVLKPEAGLAKVEKLREEFDALKRKIEAGGATDVELKRLSALAPAIAYDEALRNAGLLVGGRNYSPSGAPLSGLPQRGPPEPPPPPPPAEYSQETRALIEALHDLTRHLQQRSADPLDRPTMNVGTMWMMPDNRNARTDLPFGTGEIDERALP